MFGPKVCNGNNMEIQWVKNADVDDDVLKEFIDSIPLPLRVGFTHQPDKSKEWRLMGMKDNRIIVYAFLYHDNPSFGYLIEPQFRGIGLGDECMKQLIEAAKELGKTELVSEVFAFNVPSVKVIMNAGFQFYGPVYHVKLELQ